MNNKLEITKYLQKVIEVKAKSKEEAFNKVSEMYRNSEF